MNKLGHCLVTGTFLSLMLTAGCTIETVKPPLPDNRPASTVIINELFTLPEGHPVFFSWIELLNPTGTDVNLTRWSLTYETDRFQQSVILSTDPRDTTLPPVFIGQNVQFEARGVFDVPFAEGETVEGLIEEPTVLPSRNLFTLASSEGRLDEYTNIGPGPGPAVRYRPVIQGPFSTLVDTLSANDSVVVIRVTGKLYALAFKERDQVLLKDPSGTVVDVVRYGNYVYDGGGADPYPQNVSVGALPVFEAISRYSGGYFTGNTANDFYMTDGVVRPVPHAYNAKIKY